MQCQLHNQWEKAWRRQWISEFRRCPFYEIPPFYDSHRIWVVHNYTHFSPVCFCCCCCWWCVCVCISISVSVDLYICSLYLYNCVSGRHQIFIDVPGEAAKQSLHIQYSVVTRGKCSKLPIRHSNKPKPNEQPAKQWPSPLCSGPPPLPEEPSRPLLSIGQEPRAKSVPAFETSCLAEASEEQLSRPTQ